MKSNDPAISPERNRSSSVDSKENHVILKKSKSKKKMKINIPEKEGKEKSPRFTAPEKAKNLLRSDSRIIPFVRKRRSSKPDTDNVIFNDDAKPRKSTRPLGSYNPSVIIHKLNWKLIDEADTLSQDEIRELEVQLYNERKELMKIYRQLVAKKEKHEELKHADITIQDILSKEKQREIRNLIPMKSLQLIESEIFLATISGPFFNESVRCFKEYIAAVSTSTYPTLEGIGRAGDPICDFYHARLFEQGVLFALADGCNWGEAPKQAAHRAATCFVRHLQDRLYRMTDTRKVTTEILQAFAASHSAIMSGKTEDFFRIGTTTLIGGALLPLQKQSNSINTTTTTTTTNNESQSSSSRTAPRLRKRKSQGHLPDLGSYVVHSDPIIIPKSKQVASRPRTPQATLKVPKTRAHRRKQTPKLSPRGSGESIIDNNAISPPSSSPLQDNSVVFDDDSSSTSNNNIIHDNNPITPPLSPKSISPSTSPPSSIVIETHSSPRSKSLKSSFPSPRNIRRSKNKKKHKRKSARLEALSSTITMSPRTASRHRSVTHYGFINSEKSEIKSDDENGANINETTDWALIVGSIGDCKVFLYNPVDNIVTDITSSNRVQSINAADCGGRLGPCNKTGVPDLRNLFVVSATVKENDYILLVSDGMHDNLDPELLGKRPSDLSNNYQKSAPWEGLTLEETQALKNSFRERKLAEIICKIKRTKQNPESICSALVKYVKKITEPGRNFMETNPALELPDDYSKYPGKMDHSSCICIKVGSRNQKSDMVRDAFVRKDQLSITHSKILNSVS